MDRKKQALILIFALFCLTISAQIPSYVPQNGLKGWWQFSGNANDGSGNGYHGTVTNATLTADRFGNPNSAYSFNGTNSEIVTNYQGILGNAARTVSFWALTTSNTNQAFVVWGSHGLAANPPLRGNRFSCSMNYGSNGLTLDGADCAITRSTPTPITNGQWNFYTFVMQTGEAVNQVKLYQNGVLLTTISTAFHSTTLLNTQALMNVQFGKGGAQFYNGSLDDIGIWDRALTQAEINGLYVACSPAPTVSPMVVNGQLGGTATFNLTSANNQNINYTWQTNIAGLGWIAVPNNSTYFISPTQDLTINNLIISNHQQQFRLLTSLGNCFDTSATVSIILADTCINTRTDTNYVTITDTSYVTIYDTNYVTVTDTNFVTIYDTSYVTIYDTSYVTVHDTSFVTIYDTTYITIYDTVYVTVADTLVIKTQLGLPSNSVNTLKVYPNPASTHITIDNGNFSLMNGYSIRITNNLGQVVFNEPVNQQQFYINLSTWLGKGLYLLYLQDPQGNIADVRKIVLN
jgi:hypothetical protein